MRTLRRFLVGKTNTFCFQPCKVDFCGITRSGDVSFKTDRMLYKTVSNWPILRISSGHSGLFPPLFGAIFRRLMDSSWVSSSTPSSNIWISSFAGVLDLFRCPRFWGRPRSRVRTTLTPTASKTMSAVEAWRSEMLPPLVERQSDQKFCHQKASLLLCCKNLPDTLYT